MWASVDRVYDAFLALVPDQRGLDRIPYEDGVEDRVRGAKSAMVIGFLLLKSGRKAETVLLPEALQGSRLFASEVGMVRRDPVHVSGRPDEVRLLDGELTIIDTKRRQGRGRRVYPSDQIQLDSYAYLLRSRANGHGHGVASHAYIRFVGKEGTSFERVLLSAEEKTIARHRQLHPIRSGEVDARGARSQAVCRGCGHREICNLQPRPRGTS